MNSGPPGAATRPVFLVGLSGSGKSTIGPLLADRLSVPFIDTDAEVERRAGRSVQEIFGSVGEAAFRDLERGALLETCAAGAAVIATGGGAPVDDASRRAMAEAGFVIWLDAQTDVLANRAGAGGRPLLAGETVVALERLRNERLTAYAQSHLRVDTSARGPRDVADVIVGALPALGRFDTVWVRTPSQTYPVHVGAGLVDAAGALLSAQGLDGPYRVIADERVEQLYGDKLRRSLAGSQQTWYSVPAGEEHKTLEQVRALYDALLADRPERRDLIIALGGGVIGDVAGFVAATLLRGLRFVQIPTTLLAQVDSSVGGKVGVDHPSGKNLVGAFHQPSLVLADMDVLRTLPAREVAAGWAEVVKIAVVQDADLFAELERSADGLAALDAEATKAAVRRAIELKAALVEQDERETLGLRAVLNYGHTLGHAIEAASGYSAYLHGEAVAIGMAGAGHIAQRMGLHPSTALERQARLLRRLELPQRCEGVSRDALVAGLGLDKKRAGGRTTWVLPNELGHVLVSADVPEAYVAEAIDLVLGPAI